MRVVSVLFSEPKIPQSLWRSGCRRHHCWFQCSSASRKFLNPEVCGVCNVAHFRFSALQRAENSSIVVIVVVALRVMLFQCSSASRKFLNPNRAAARAGALAEFQCSSASRKFLNPRRRAAVPSPLLLSFQCSSASRKFLNPRSFPHLYQRVRSFSALQRAENSSIGAGL